jgi:hypothetical protein
MDNSFNELTNAVTQLYRASNVIEQYAAWEHLKEVLSAETSVEVIDKAREYLHDMVRENVLSDALTDYETNPGLYPEFVRTLVELRSRLEGKCAKSRFDVKDANRLWSLWARINELGNCESETEIRALVDELSANFDQHPEYCEEGYSRLRWEIEYEIIGAYMEAFFSVNRSSLAQYRLSLLVATQDLNYYGYPLDFLYFENGRFEVLTPENLYEEEDSTTLRKKLETLIPGFIHLDILAYHGYIDLLTHKSARAVLDAVKSSADWSEVSETTVLLAKYLGDLLRDGLRGLTESVEDQDYDRAVDNFIYAQFDLHKVCTDLDVGKLSNNWSEFLLHAASSPDMDALTNQSILALTFSLLSAVDTGDLPETIQCLIRFLSAITAWPMSITYNEYVRKWIANGD